MHYSVEQARRQTMTAESLIREVFGPAAETGCLDAEFLDGARTAALGFAGLPFVMPVCRQLLNRPETAAWLAEKPGCQLLVLSADGALRRLWQGGEEPVPESLEPAVRDALAYVADARGSLNEQGELTLDLKKAQVGPHYPINLLLGDRRGCPQPLQTTPKSVLDGLGRGSFRASAGKQVLATRYVLNPEENGEPANRQFYLYEDGRQIFYSADVWTGVESAVCTHSQNRTVIRYRTACGLEIVRTIFILPQEDGMPSAVEAQRIEIVNHGARPRNLRLVLTGVFGIAEPGTIAGDVVYANLVVESEIWYDGGRPAAVSVHHKPWDCQSEKRFALLLHRGETMDSFCASQSDFIGNGTLQRPEHGACLSNRLERKMSSFFALGKAFTAEPGVPAVIDAFVGMTETEGQAEPVFDEQLRSLIRKYADPAALPETLSRVIAFSSRYSSYMRPETGDPMFDAYTGHNLPFQVLYQTFVSRSFAWTQKSYRETGFREIQDIYASMYYLHGMGEDALIRELLSSWIVSVFRMGYAYHNFTFRGKEPGDCSDDQLWLVQAVYRYVRLTGDTAFLRAEFAVAGEDAVRPLWETIMAILTYSGRISVGRHGLPLLDKADWNDTLRLDRQVMKGPEKEAAYRKQLAETGEAWGAPLKNTQSESVMNACLLLTAADEAAELAEVIGEAADGARARELAARLRETLRRDAWKDGYFARCLINDGRKYTYIGAGGDGLSLDPAVDGSYFLNSFSWAVLSGAASEEQIDAMLTRVEKYLKTDAGLKLCTLIHYDLLGVRIDTGLYFPGDRENGGVFKHAAMMAVTASLQAAKTVRDEGLARRLAALAFFMIDKTLPYKAMEDPFVRKGNPRFCTQYNNSETGENIGPMLSGTASWLTLALFEAFGAEVNRGRMTVRPILREGTDSLRYSMRIGSTVLHVEINGNGRFRAGETTRRTVDGAPVDETFPLPMDGGEHMISLSL